MTAALELAEVTTIYVESDQPHTCEPWCKKAGNLSHVPTRTNCDDCERKVSA